MTLKTIALCAASGAALAYGTAGWAQTTPAPQTAPSGAEAAPALGEIVVTARRREERLQDVPIAVTAVTPQTLQQNQVVTARQLVGITPSLNINSGNQRDYQRYAIRAQGSTFGAGEAVTVYIAEAPVSQYISGGPGLYFDLANLQVLNGPQGTLFGRNTTGGAVLFTPQQPTDRDEGFVQAGYGNYNNREFAAVLNFAPAPGVLRFRFSADLRRRDGFTTDVLDGSKLDDINYRSFRASALYTPTDWFSNYLIASYTTSKTGGTSIHITDVNPNAPANKIFGVANLQAQLALQQQLGPWKTLDNGPHWWETGTFLAVDTATVKLSDNLTVKNIVSFSRVKASGGFDNDGTIYPIQDWVKTSDSGQPSGVGESRNDYITEELQLQGAGLEHRLNWTLGGFYENSYPYGYQQIVQNAANVISYNESALSTTSKALFAQATLDFGVFSPVLDRLKLTTGYRYSWDTRHLNSFVFTNAGSRPCQAVAGAFFPNCSLALAGKFEAPTYNVTLDYKLTPRILAYVTHRTGYKSGGFNVNANVRIPKSFAPEKVKDTEIGLKGDYDVAGMPLRADIDLFKDDYADIQRTVTLPDPLLPGNTLIYTANAASATIKGVEAEITFKPINALTFDLTYSYLEASYDNYPGFLDLRTNTVVNLAGTALPFAPKNKVGVQTSYQLPLAEDVGQVTAYVNANYQSHYRAFDQVQPEYRQGGYSLVNLGVNWERVYGKPVDLEIFATNVSNTLAIAASQAYYYSAGTSAVSYIEPRMYGFRFRYHFE